MSRFPDIALAAGLILLGAGSAVQAQDAAAGEAVFNKCKACHMVGEGAKNRVGPVLNGVVNRAAAAVDGYKYSKAMKEAGDGGLVWDEANLTAYLHKPRDFLKGTKMAFPGLKDDADVANVIAYLASFDETGAKVAAAEPEAEPETEVAEENAAPPAETTPGGPGGLVTGLGREATPEEVAAWDIDVRPDGLGLPPGRGTVAEGTAIYDEQCAACHGDFGEAIDRWPVLAGGQGTLTDDRPVKTIGSYWPFLSTVYDYVHRAMPFGNARSLSDDDVYALTAYLLYLNDIVDDEEFELSSANFGDVEMPNAGNFIPDDRAQEPFYANKAEPCMSDCKPGSPEITMHAAVLDVTPEDSGDDDGPAGGAID